MNILYLELANRDLFDPRVAPDHLQRGMISWQKHKLSYVECMGGVYRKNEVVLYHRNKEGMGNFRLTHAQFDYWVNSNDGYTSYDISLSTQTWDEDMKSIFEALKVINK